MTMKDAQNCLNFRDVGEFVNCIAGVDLLYEGRILRGGNLNLVKTTEEIGNPRTIINLRRGPDPANKYFGALYQHFPFPKNAEVYETESKIVKKWLNLIFQTIEKMDFEYPIFFHCTSGKDRTGVVIAALLLTLGIDREIIVTEYMLSDGDIDCNWILNALGGIVDLASYFPGISVVRIRQHFLI